MAVLPGIDRAEVGARPRLVFFYSPVCGRCRRAEGLLAQVLQRRHNHEPAGCRELEELLQPWLR